MIITLSFILIENYHRFFLLIFILYFSIINLLFIISFYRTWNHSSSFSSSAWWFHFMSPSPSWLHYPYPKRQLPRSLFPSKSFRNYSKTLAHSFKTNGPYTKGSNSPRLTCKNWAKPLPNIITSSQGVQIPLLVIKT